MSVCFRRSSLMRFTPLDNYDKGLSWTAYARKINVEITPFDPFAVFGLREDENSPLEMLEPLFMSFGEHYDFVQSKCKPGSVLFSLSDYEPPQDACLLIASNQQMRKSNCGTHVGFYYPVFENKAKIIDSAYVPYANREFALDLYFEGWYDHGYTNPIRLDAVKILQRFSGEKRLVLHNAYAFSPYEQWLSTAMRSKLCLVLPGIGVNTWRLSELMLAGCCCVVASPIDDLDLFPPLRHMDNCIVAKIETLEASCASALRLSNEKRGMIAARARNDALSAVVQPAWNSVVRKRIECTAAKWLNNRGFRPLLSESEKTYCSLRVLASQDRDPSLSVDKIVLSRQADASHISFCRDRRQC